MKKVLLVVLALALMLSAVACATSNQVAQEPAPEKEEAAAPAEKEEAAAPAEKEEAAAPAEKEEAPAEKEEAPAEKEDAEQKFVGISFPSTMVDRWPAEAEFLKADLEAMGYKAEIQYADENANGA